MIMRAYSLQRLYKLTKMRNSIKQSLRNSIKKVPNQSLQIKMMRAYSLQRLYKPTKMRNPIKQILRSPIQKKSNQKLSLRRQKGLMSLKLHNPMTPYPLESRREASPSVARKQPLKCNRKGQWCQSIIQMRRIPRPLGRPLIYLVSRTWETRAFSTPLPK